MKNIFEHSKQEEFIGISHQVVSNNFGKSNKKFQNSNNMQFRNFAMTKWRLTTRTKRIFNNFIILWSFVSREKNKIKERTEKARENHVTLCVLLVEKICYFFSPSHSFHKWQYLWEKMKLNKTHRMKRKKP